MGHRREHLLIGRSPVSPRQSCQVACPAAPPHPRACSGAWWARARGPATPLLGRKDPAARLLFDKARQAIFGRKLGRASRNRPRAGFGNLKFIFHFLGYFKSDSNFQNSYQIHFLSKNYETSSIILLNLRSIQ
jgi:hypothetical protein